GPGLVRRGWMIEGPDHPFDDVIDVGKVSAHLSVVVHLDRFSLQNRLCEYEEGHIGPRPRSIDRKKPQTRAGNPIEMRIAMGHKFIGLLARRIERDRMIDVVMNRKWHLGIAAIDGTRRGIDEVLDLRVPAAFQNVEKPFDITVRIGMWVH